MKIAHGETLKTYRMGPGIPFRTKGTFRIVRADRIRSRSVLILFLCLLSLPLLAQDFVCGITTGFPPYQFLEGGQPAGFDADVIRLVAARAGLTLRFEVARWDDLLHYLRQGQIHCITGMEMTAQRREMFDFTIPYYERTNAVFVRAEDTWIKDVEDLFHQRITGDRQSDIEELWAAEGRRGTIRIQQTETKEEAMQLLAEGHSLGAIMPRGVGLYLADEMDVAVRILFSHPRGTPVALAVRKGGQALRETLNRALEELIGAGEVDALYEGWIPGGE